MIKKLIPACCLLLCTVFSLTAQANQDDIISGEIVTGYRVLPVNPENSGITLTVYRGDYIKFSYPQTAGSLLFTMPQLQYKDHVTGNPETSPFFKMKTTGTYDFTLGQATGSVTVIELSRPNYIAVSAEEGEQILQNLQPFILDVRTPQEYRKIHIKGTTLIPIRQLQARIGELESKKHEDIFIYCATGNRSTVAARILANQGFKRIYNLRYGIFDWARKGYPYTKGK